MKVCSGKFFIALFLLAFLTSCEKPKDEVNVESLTFANLVPLWWNAQSVLFEPSTVEGVDVKTISFQTGKESKNAVLQGNADIGIVAASPLVLSAVQKEQGFKVLARYMSGSELVGVFSKASNEGSLQEPIAIVGGTVSEFFLHAWASRKGLELSDNTTLLNVKPPSIEKSLLNGDANSTVIWEPFAQSIYENPKLNLQLSKYPKELYSMKFFIIANEESLKTKAELIKKFVTQFKLLSEKLSNDNGELRRVVEQKSNLELGSLKGRWEKVDFSFVVAREDLVADLTKEADIIIRAGQLNKVPDFKQLF